MASVVCEIRIIAVIRVAAATMGGAQVPATNSVQDLGDLSHSLTLELAGQLHSGHLALQASIRQVAGSGQRPTCPFLKGN